MLPESSLQNQYLTPFEKYRLEKKKLQHEPPRAPAKRRVQKRRGKPGNPRVKERQSRKLNSDLENPGKLQSQKRLFSCFFSKTVPPLPGSSERKAYPWKSSNWISRAMFYWIWPSLVTGYTRTLQPNDLWYLPDDMKVEVMHQRFEKNLQSNLSKAKLNHIKKHGNLEGFKWPSWILPLSIFMTFKLQYTMSCVYLGLAFCCQSLSPLLTRHIIDFVEQRYFGEVKSNRRGVAYTIPVVALIFIDSIFLNHYFHSAMVTGAQAKAILTKSILLKSFKLSAKARFDFPKGRILSLMSTDLARIDLAIGFQPLVICVPVPLIISIVLLLYYIGAAALTGIGLFAVSLFICALATVKLFATREKAANFTDDRVSLIREVLGNLKVIKFYAWELAYKLRITQIRAKEMNYLYTIAVIRNFVTAYAITMPTLTSMLSFVTMWATDKMKTPGEVFSSLSLFTILAQSIMLLPIALSAGADAHSGFKRCNAFLCSDEQEVEQDSYLKEKDTAVALEAYRADFAWDSYHSESVSETSLLAEKHFRSHSQYGKYHFTESRTSLDASNASDDFSFQPVYSNSTTSTKHGFQGLLDVNLCVQSGEFVIITGLIGSGKSALLSALAGLMKITNPQVGELSIYGSLIMCSEPWIQNATVRQNILFGKKFERKKYKAIVHACCLEDDLALLAAGDCTEIGERGTTLSGGQKARISLARACYADTDIILLDDILSAVDSNVGQHIVNRLIFNYLKDKTRILATHQLQLVDQADKVVFLNGDGTLDVGTSQLLRNRNPAFNRLLEFSHGSAEEEDVVYENSPTYHKEFLGDDSISLDGKTLQDEERAVNAIGWDIYKKYISLGSGIFGYFAVPIFIFWLIMGTFCQVFTNTWLSWWTEKKLKGKSDNFYVALYVMFAFLTVVFTAIEFCMLAYLTNRSARELNSRALSKILHAPMSFMDTNPLGRIMNRFTKDTDSLDNEVGDEIKLLVFPLAMIIGVVILCITYLPWFALAVPVLGFGFIFLANFYSASSREVKRLEALQRSVVYNNFNEILTGMNTIKSYFAETMFIGRNDQFINRMNEAYYLSIANQRWLSIHLDIIASAFALIICLLCITQVFPISASSTGLLLSYTIQIVGLLSLTIRAMTQVENEMNSVERVHSYAFQLPQEAAYTRPEFKPPPEWPNAGHIVFENVNMKYREHLPTILKNLSFDVRPGAKIGICGRTGAGKSSIMAALYRLNELESGRILIDGIDIADLGLYDLRSRLSIIPQDPVLFQSTIRKNLDPFEEHEDEVLWDSLRRAGLIDESSLERIKTSDAMELPKFHLSQMVVDNGSNFSLGEKQLMALARALVRDSKILILDEATSSVDYMTDSVIQNTIHKEFLDCTILCIAHRLRTILLNDFILVIEGGRCVESGQPVDLFKKGGIFTQMCLKAGISNEDFV